MTWSIAQSSWQQLVTHYSQESKSSIILPVTISRKPLLLISNSYAAIKVLTIADTGNILGKWLKAALKIEIAEEKVKMCDSVKGHSRKESHETLPNLCNPLQNWRKSESKVFSIQHFFLVFAASVWRHMLGCFGAVFLLRCASAQMRSTIHSFIYSRTNT